MTINTPVPAINPVNNQAGVLPVVGFVVKKFTATAPSEKDEEGVGKIQITLEAQSDEIKAAGKDLASILGALNMHRMDREAVAVQLRFG